MKKSLSFLFIIFTQIYAFSGQIHQYFNYLDPLPGAKYVSKNADIILNLSAFVDKNSVLSSNSISVSGSFSGEHAGNFVNSDDKSVIIFKPAEAFYSGEKVTVNISDKIKTIGGEKIRPFSYAFYIREKENVLHGPMNFWSELNSDDIAKLKNSGTNPDGINELPVITINYSSTPSDGYIFLSNIVFSPSIPNDPHLLILKNNGQVYFQKEMSNSCFDFKPQPNGNLTYFDNNAIKFFEMDTSFNIIDSFYCGNNYYTDPHELRVLANGHALVISYDTETVDMSHIISGGDQNARVVGLVLQEIDVNKNVVFQWRSWDHYQITDATHENLTAPVVDYVHGNAVESDNDGNILLSCRHMDEITKINRLTGSIIWRLGGKNNQFTFINDPIGFSHQHSVRRIANGNITMFDNGNFHTPSFSRAVEYMVDEQNKTATLVWQYRNNPDIYGAAMGYVERLANGNTFIGWGAANPSVTEVKSDGTKVYEMTLPVNVYSYRAFRYKWKDPAEVTVLPGAYNLGQNYPNPFNPTTSIQFDVPVPQSGAQIVPVKIVVYDMLGREVSQLENTQLQPGKYTVNWDALGYASGVYFYRLNAGSYSQTKRMMLIK